MDVLGGESVRFATTLDGRARTFCTRPLRRSLLLRPLELKPSARRSATSRSWSRRTLPSPYTWRTRHWLGSLDSDEVAATRDDGRARDERDALSAPRTRATRSTRRKGRPDAEVAIERGVVVARACIAKWARPVRFGSPTVEHDKQTRASSANFVISDATIETVRTRCWRATRGARP